MEIHHNMVMLWALQFVGLNIIATFKLLSTSLILRMMCYSVSDAGTLGKTKSECSYQESKLRPSDNYFGCSTTELPETRGS